MEELQRTMNDLEAKYKSELSRLKKKYETEIREHEIQIDTLNRNNAELNKANKSLAARLKVRLAFIVNIFNISECIQDHQR